MFENAKVGQRVWSYTYGWGKIVGVSDDLIDFRFDCDFYCSYTQDGRLHRKAINQDLFYDEIKVEIPESAKKPKIEWKFPCYGKHIKSGIVVLIDSSNHGVVVVGDELFAVGEDIIIDDICNFTPCTLEAKEL